ncbi:uncharacterized membrane protein [[Candida] jaroonii]|uniref:Uncharacterized membrane protein n=1 Tax=[Candida] jaroonii TaxID=467808 RepID=A0ACA9YG93_9ASCO|nr:uncharacterized membrane protein [[Candida] jaroonii]
MMEIMKGFPFFTIFCIGLLRFSEPVAFCSLFPYIYRYIKQFGVPDESVAIYSGYLSSIFPLTQFFFSVPLGHISDRYGYKPVVIFGLLGTAFAMLIFGFAGSYKVAFIARMLMGAVNSNVAILRTMIGSVVKDRNHQAIAFLIIPLLYNVGSVIGPMIGGSPLLVPSGSLPEDPSSYQEFIHQHPFAMPNIVVAIFILLSTTIGILFIKETNPRATYRDYGSELGDMILKKLGFDPEIKTSDLNSDTTQIEGLETEESPLIRDVFESIESDEDSDDSASVGPMSPRIANMVRRYSEHSSIREISTNYQILTPPVIHSIFANLILFFHLTIQAEFFPVFLAGPKPKMLKFPFTMSGGFDLSITEIGNILALTGFSGIATMLFFPVLDRYFKSSIIYQVSILPLPLIFFSIPFVMFTIPEYSHYSSKVHIYLLYSLSILYELLICIAIPVIALMIHRVAPPKHKGLVNSIALSMSSLARSMGPMVWGYLMSYFDSINFGGGSWFILSGICLIAVVQSFFLIDHEEHEE